MGVSITGLLKRKEIKLEDLTNKTILVDAPMWLYQFLSSIRQRDGNYLTDSKGKPTSHLVGLSSRIPNLLEKNIRLAFVFDGKPSELKSSEIEKRRGAKAEAKKKYEQAAEEEDEQAMRKYASMTTKLTSDMIDDAKNLIKAFGIPVIQAPSEAEAQGSYMVKEKKAYALATNDADALMFGAPLIVRNLNLVGKRKQANRFQYKNINPEAVSLKQTLEQLGISNDQLIVLCMLVGTDFNTGGIKGIGPKKALKLVKEHKDNLASVFKEAEWDQHFDYGWQEVFDTIKEMPVTDDYELNWAKPDPEKLKEVLVEKHDFSQERLNSILEKMGKQADKKQKSLGDF
jgi:flap endonuclease-1